MRLPASAPDTPWLELIIDRTQAKDRGVSIDDIRTTLESTLGPYDINDFNRFGRTWQVNVQALNSFRQSVVQGPAGGYEAGDGRGSGGRWTDRSNAARRIERELLPMAAGLGVTAWSPLAGGLFLTECSLSS